MVDVGVLLRSGYVAMVDVGVLLRSVWICGYG